MFLNLGVLLWVMWLLFSPVLLTETFNEPFPVEPQIVERGGDITIFIEFEKFTNYRVDIHKNIICNDGSITPMAPQASQAPIGVHYVEAEVTIPRLAPTGTCYIEFTNTYHINALRNEERVRMTEEFVIIE